MTSCVVGGWFGSQMSQCSQHIGGNISCWISIFSRNGIIFFESYSYRFGQWFSLRPYESLVSGGLHFLGSFQLTGHDNHTPKSENEIRWSMQCRLRQIKRRWDFPIK